MPAKKLVVAFLIIIVAIGGFVAGLALLRERQNIQEEAAVPGGQAEVSVTPNSGSYEVGDTFTSEVYFNTANIAISGVAVRMVYPFSGATPEISVQSITINSALTSTGDWTCPTQNASQEGANMVIDIGCGVPGLASGFKSSGDTLLATINFQVDREPTINPLVLRFDSSKSIITRKSDNQDILLIPTSTGSYTIGDAGLASPTPTSVVTTTITTTPTPTSISSVSATITPTTTTKGGEELPDAGVSYPTFFGVGLGVMVIIGAMLIAI